MPFWPNSYDAGTGEVPSRQPSPNHLVEPGSEAMTYSPSNKNRCQCWTGPWRPWLLSQSSFYRLVFLFLSQLVFLPSQGSWLKCGPWPLFFCLLSLRWLVCSQDLGCHLHASNSRNSLQGLQSSLPLMSYLKLPGAWAVLWRSGYQCASTWCQIEGWLQPCHVPSVWLWGSYLILWAPVASSVKWRW